MNLPLANVLLCLPFFRCRAFLSNLSQIFLDLKDCFNLASTKSLLISGVSLFVLGTPINGGVGLICSNDGSLEAISGFNGSL